MAEKISYIPTRLKNTVKGGHVAGAEDIIDDALNRKQSEINQEVVGEDATSIKNRLNSIETILDKEILVIKKITDGEMDEVLGGDVAVYLTDINGNAVLDDKGEPIEII